MKQPKTNSLQNDHHTLSYFNSFYLFSRKTYFEFICSSCVGINDETMQLILNENEGNPKKQEMIKAMTILSHESIRNMVGKRCIKSHLAFSLMPPSVMSKRAKIIYVARNPKDVMVSHYYLSCFNRAHGYVNDFDTFCEYFENGLSKTVFN